MCQGFFKNLCEFPLQERLHRSIHMNGGSYHSPNAGPHPPVPHRPLAEGYNPPANAANLNVTSPYIPVSRPTNPQDTQQQPEVLGPVKLTCKQCQKQFSSKPEVLQFKVEIGQWVILLVLFYAKFVFEIDPVSLFVCLRITWASSAHASVATCIRGKEMSKQYASTAKKNGWPRTSSSMISSRRLSVAKVRFRSFSFQLSFSRAICVLINSKSNVMRFWYIDVS